MTALKNHLLISLMAFTTLFKAQEIIPLYSGEIPNSKPCNLVESSTTTLRASDSVMVERVSHVTKPELIAFFPPAGKANGTSVIICPGGAYKILAINIEGYDVAKKLNAAGITAFVLKYRLPSDTSMRDKSIGPLQDAQRAIQLVKENAEKWRLDSTRVGLMGFSAGGHLASTAATHFKEVIPNAQKINLIPSFLILAYPVISFEDSLTHLISRSRLLGPSQSPEAIHLYSNDKQVSSKTPKTFIVHAIDDKGVKVENSLYFIAALKKYKVPVEVFLYAKGGHGFGILNKTTPVNWIDDCIRWINTN
ncbi:alpha/beta hydrolase [Sphingobacteriaceae bacterium]|nr:alpha/beta hydrolase [Sphingobacteriaceae bacterium]